MKTRRYLLALLLTVSCACCGSEQQGTNEQFKLRATVQDVSVLQQFTGKVVLVQGDPRFALTLRIESVTPPLNGYTNGSIVTFAIHSPTRLFAGETPTGKTVDFILSREVKGSTKGAFTLEVAANGGQPNGAVNRSQPVQPETNRGSPAAGSGG